MPTELRFSSKLFSKIKVPAKPVKPTLHLSKAALETPLPDGNLRDIRDFLTRGGRWKGHPIDSVEAFLAIPAPGVNIKVPVPAVVGLKEPVFTSVGFGMEGVTGGAVLYSTGVCEAHNTDSKCDTYMCITHATRLGVTPHVSGESIGAETCFDSHCKSNMCGTNSCSSQLCGTQRCIFHDCSNHLCSEQNSVALTAELAAQSKHPFVKELGRYFGIDMGDKLAKAVMHYVGRNMFDESAR